MVVALYSGLKECITAARNYLNPADVDYVIYHYPCADGSGAAFSAWMMHKDEITYNTICHQREIIFDYSELSGKKVVVLDCAFKKNELELARSTAHTVMILDHHESNIRLFDNQNGCFFTTCNSGAVLAWHYFHGLEASPPQFLQFIEDRDLLAWNQREYSEPFAHSLVKSNPTMDFRMFKKYLDKTYLKQMILEGKKLLNANLKYIVDLASKAIHAKFFDSSIQDYLNVICVQMPSYDLTVETAEYLYTNYDVDFVMLWHELPEDKYRISLRTNKCNVDLSLIAISLGGGGHENKAGVIVEQHPLKLLTI